MSDRAAMGNAAHGLGRRSPSDQKHELKYPLQLARTTERAERVLKLPYAYRPKYNQGTEGACFPAGTLVQLADGSWKEIDAIRLLDDVRTAEGNTGKVYQTMVRWHDDDLVNVQLRGHSGVRMTPEHPVLTKRGYVAAKDLAIGDLVALTRTVREDVSTSIETGRYLLAADGRRTTNGIRRYADRHGGATIVAVIEIPKRIELTPASGRLMGLYLAEGSTTDQKVTWAFGGHERDTLVQETASLIKSELGIEPHIQFRPSGTYNVVIYGKRWRVLFERLFFTGSGNKRIPAELASASDDVRRSVLEGWLSGDGHRRRTQVAGVTISPSLALGMFTIANDLGMCPTIRMSAPSMNRHAATRQDRWDVEIPEGDGHRPVVDDRATWRKVSGLTHEEWSGFVYNMAVAGDQSYVAGGMGVHNCVGYAASWAVSILNRRFYDARWLYRESQKVDEWPGESYDGTSVRAGMDVLRTVGHKLLHKHDHDHPPELEHGIIRNEWARSVDQIRTCITGGTPVVLGVDWMSNFDDPVLKGREYWIGEGDLGQVRGGHAICAYGASDKRQAVKLVNSWGRDYPLAWISYDVLQRLLDGIAQPGEATVFTDREEV